MKNSWVVLLGAGAGHILEALHDSCPEALARLIVLEPIGELYKSKELRRRILSFLQSPDRLVSNPMELRPLIKSLKIPDFQVYVLPAYRRAWPEAISKLIQEIAEGAKAEGRLDEASRKKFIRIWTANAIRNCLSAKRLSFLTTPFPDRGPDTSVSSIPSNTLVYCGAAPSLPKDLARLGILPGLPSSFHLISSDTALPYLLHQGYRPSLCISVDASAASRWHFSMLEKIRGLSLPLEIPLLTWLSGPVYFGNYFSKIIFYRSSFPLDQILGQGPLQKIPEWKNPSRNVAGLSLLLARSLGASRLYLAGASFTGQDGKSHIPGSGYELYPLCLQNRLNGLSAYQPQSYLKVRAETRQGRRGLELLARKLEIELVWLSKDRILPPNEDKALSLTETESPSKNLTLDLFLQKLRPIVVEIESQKLCNYLLDFLEHFGLESWKQSSLPADWHDKGRRILKSRL